MRSVFCGKEKRKLRGFVEGELNRLNVVEQMDNGVPSKQTEAPVILPYEHDREYFIEPIGKVKKKPIYQAIKRLVDIVGSLCALCVFAIPMLVIAIIIKADSKGPVFYCQERLGLNGKPFHCIKFRSMRLDAECNGAQWSAGDDDPRITKVGRFIRKYRLDELPQFFLTLSGKMTLVGPRPERACFYQEFETYIHGFSQRLKVKPGFTGLAQVSGGYDLRPEEKIVYDMEYIKKRSLWLDVKILFRTVKVVLCGESAK